MIQMRKQIRQLGEIKVWSGGLTATVASYVIHSGRNGVLTGPQQTIRLSVAVGRRDGRGGGPFVAWLSEDGPVKLVTLWWISSCRLLAPLPCLSSP